MQLLQVVRSMGNGSSVSSSAALNTPQHTLADLFNEFLLSKCQAGRSDNYLRVMHTALAGFAENREGQAVASISAAEVERYLYGQGWKPKTIKNNLLILRTVFEWGVKRGMAAGNVAMAVDVPTQENEPPAIHQPGQVRHILETARGLDLNLTRFLAIRYFAGLRASEAAALEDSEIGRDFIEVKAAKAKTRRRRLVTIQPCLRSWLALGGRLPLGDVNTRMWRLTRALGQPWERNAPRHSFCSYHLAQFQSAGKTALEAGHTEQMLFQHYRELVTPDAAAEFWSILPIQ